MLNIITSTKFLRHCVAWNYALTQNFFQCKTAEKQLGLRCIPVALLMGPPPFPMLPGMVSLLVVVLTVPKFKVATVQPQQSVLQTQVRQA